MDVLLNGGVYTAEMVEFEGEVAAGKTQVCMSAAVMYVRFAPYSRQRHRSSPWQEHDHIQCIG